MDIYIYMYLYIYIYVCVSVCDLPLSARDGRKCPAAAMAIQGPHTWRMAPELARPLGDDSLHREKRQKKVACRGCRGCAPTPPKNVGSRRGGVDFAAQSHGRHFVWRRGTQAPPTRSSMSSNCTSIQRWEKHVNSFAMPLTRTRVCHGKKGIIPSAVRKAKPSTTTRAEIAQGRIFHV